jgi:putative photosynthetic complex assembly protein
MAMSIVVPGTRISLPAIVLGGLAVIVVGIAVVSRVTPPEQFAPVGEVPVAARNILFTDMPNGGVQVTDAADGKVLEMMPPESNNFVRATMRGLVRQRVLQHIGPEVPFRLTAWPDGGLTLEDPAIHRTLELAAFGSTNAAAFARILSLQAEEK